MLKTEYMCLVTLIHYKLLSAPFAVHPIMLGENNNNQNKMSSSSSKHSR